jgi:glycine hydroxymethyltransferase
VDIQFNFADFDIDVKALTSLAWRERTKLIVVGSPLCLFPYDLRALRQIADDVGAHILYDAAHPLGLISGGEFQSPLAEGADIVTGSTHKSLPGPIGGVVLVRDADLAERVRRTADDLESNYMNNRILALGITLAEMMAFGSSYARACIENAQQLAVEFSARGITPIGSRGLFTMSNMIVLDTRGYGPATELAKRLESAGIIVSAVGLPGVDGQASGLRIGVQDVTRHGLRVEHIPIVAGLVSRVVSGESPERIRSETRELAETLAHVGYCFDRLDVPEGSP